MFSDVIGHKEVVEWLKSALRSGRIANSYIFSGPENIGKEFVAINFAKALNCISDNEDSCDECISCRKIDDGNHPDIVVIRPQGTRLKIDQMRSLQRQGSYRAMEGKRKVYIITEAEKMTPEAANSLLKTLEEPPGAMVLILVTSVYNALLPTIRSRCQAIKLSLAPSTLLYRELVSRFAIPESEAKWIALRAQGKVGKALALMKDGKKDSADEVSIPFSNFSQKDSNALLNIFKEAETLGKSQDSLDILLSWYRDLLLIKQGCSDVLLVHSDKKDELERMAQSCSDFQIEKLIKNTLKTRNLMRRNINSTLALEVLMLQSLETLSTRL